MTVRRIATLSPARPEGDAARLHRCALTITTKTGEFTMSQRTWFITGVSSGLGRELTEQLLERGDRVVGTVRYTGKVADLRERYPETFRAEVLDVTDTAVIYEVLERSFAELVRIDVIISNAGYGLFGAAEELTDKQVEHIVATNLVGPIQLIRAALPHLRARGGGRVIQISSYGGQVAFPGNSMYHATKWGIEGFVESVAQEVASFGIGMRSSSPAARAPSSATVARRWQSSCPSTTKPRHTASCRCWIPKRGVWPLVTRPEWPRASSRAWT
jgi:NAD(P)-dependent dehydrogenase (short-subunit alcohol dehydrogenase family)